MSDNFNQANISVNQASFFGNEKPTKIVPKYLVLIDDLEEVTVKKSTDVLKANKFISKFIAVKYEEGQHVAKLTGFFYVGSEKEINEKYLEIIQAADKSIYVEVQVPWTRIIRVQNLIYKSK